MWRKLLVALMIAVVFMAPVLVFAQANDHGLGATQRATGGLLPPSIIGASNVPEFIGVIINIVLGFLGIVFFLLVFYAGILWMTARGDEGKIDQAKETIMAAVIGLVIIMAAYAITRFVFTSLGATGGESAPTAAPSPTSPASVTDCSGQSDGTACGGGKVCKLNTCVTTQDAACMAITIEANCGTDGKCFWANFNSLAKCRTTE